MKEFDYEKAKAGAPVCTRDGRPARIVCWDGKGGNMPILALVATNDGCELAYWYNEKGESGCDVGNLMMVPTKQEGWLYLYYDGPDVYTSHCVFRTKEDASKAAREIVRDGETQIVKIEWEE